jgi:hypothetical protein
MLSNKVIGTGEALRTELESRPQTRKVWDSLDFKEEQDRQTAERLTREATSARELGGLCYMMHRYMDLPDGSRWTSGLPELPDDVTCMALGTLEIDRLQPIPDSVVLDGAEKEIKDRPPAPDYERNRLVRSNWPTLLSTLNETDFKLPPIRQLDGTFSLPDYRRWDITTPEGERLICKHFPYMDLHLDAHRSRFMSNESTAISGLYEETIDWFGKAHPHGPGPIPTDQSRSRSQQSEGSKRSTGNRDRSPPKTGPGSANYFNPRHYTAPESSKGKATGIDPNGKIDHMYVV